MYKPIKTIIRIFALIAGVLLFIIFMSLYGPGFIRYYERGIYYGYDLILEYKLSKAIDKIKKNNDLQPIALQNLSDKIIRKTCVQWEYATQSYFEERIGEKVKDFNETADFDGDILWLFFSDGSVSRARIPMYFWSDDNKKINFWNIEKSHCTLNTLTISLKAS